MALMDFFRPPQQQQQSPQGQQQQAAPSGQPPQGQQGQQSQKGQAGGAADAGGAPTNPDGTPKAGTASNDPNNFKNPLDVYADLFHNAEDPNAPKAPEFKLSPDIISKAAGSINFTDGLPPELSEKLARNEVLTGQEMLNLLNHAGRQSYAKSVEHLSSLTDRFVGLRSQFEQQGLPKQLQRLLASNKAASLPGASSNPVVRAHMELISSSLAAKYPDQSPDWIAEKAQGFFMEMAKALDPTLASSAAAGGTGGQGAKALDMQNFDWDGYLKDKAA